MNDHPHRTPGRWAAIALLLLVIALAVALFAAPTLWLHQRYDAYLDDYTDRLQRYRRVAALRPAIEAATTEVLKREGGKFYLHASSQNLAAAELQSLVTRTVERHKGRVVSSQTLIAKEEGKAGDPLKVSIDVNLAAPIVPLQLILHAIETHVPYVFVEKAALTSVHGRAYRPVPGVQPEYNVQLTISGYILPVEAQP